VVLKVAKAVVVVVTRLFRTPAIITLLLASVSASAAILPEDRADILFHSYDGGGVTIDGPSILVRKKIGESFSVSGNYYVDSITSASIDVITTASPYSEERTEYGLSMDYLRDKVTISTAFTQSDENDFSAKSYHFGISQEVFGGLTTISLGYSRGSDVVGKLGDPTFAKPADRENYRISVSQVLTKNLLMEVGFEAVTDEGYLNNPYRQVRYINPGNVVRGYDYEDEIYPNTRTTTALALRAKYYLPYRAAIHGEYRFFNDTWGIKGNTIELGYTHPLKKNWIFDFNIRSYSQTAADFYSDLFPFQGAQNFLARDKELSEFSSFTIGAGVSYEFSKNFLNFIDKGSVNLSLKRIQFDYDNFRDVRVVATPGTEPLYSFDADVIQLYLSLWY